MCGINGILSLDIKGKDSLIRRMNSALQHRGPDNSDSFSNSQIALGHQRLSIIDISIGGNQPMISQDGRYVLVYNGEIYNFHDLKKDLDYPFKSKSDSEVVLAAYIKWGKKCVEYFNGMFAFAIWDNKSQNLYLARDRLGIKPLYFYHAHKSFIFSSEIRALLSTNLVNANLSISGLVDFLKYNTVYSPNTIIDNIQQLEPGSYINYDSTHKLTKYKYWSPNSKKFNTAKLDEYQIRDLIFDQLRSSVNMRMYSDVQSGAFLSGGIDSSTLVALMCENSSQKIKTYNVSFEEDDYDESKYARMIAEKYSTDHTEIKLRCEDFLKSIPSALKDMDHPSGDGPNSWIVSKATREQEVKMVFSGLGGDELFAGYPKFKSLYKMDKHRWVFDLPKFIKQKIISRLILTSDKYTKAKICQIIKRDGYNFRDHYMCSRQVLLDIDLHKILSNEIKNHISSSTFPITDLGIFESDYVISKISVAELQSYMQDILLRDTDQMSMSHGLEVRVPFLDHNLVELALSIEDKYKYPTVAKKLLLDSVKHLLPSAVYDRRKMGFTFPWNSWLKNELGSLAEDSINSLSKREYFNESQVLNLWERFKSGNSTIKSSSIWSFIVLENWLNINNINA